MPAEYENDCDDDVTLCEAGTNENASFDVIDNRSNNAVTKRILCVCVCIIIFFFPSTSLRETLLPSKIISGVLLYVTQGEERKQRNTRNDNTPQERR
mmetsp:Transcript_7962/g.10969  ORF Transcript_7962/g.10969 Transcript_7962/m.10969 type:complete len:97 (-) Transcript_7962:96-386(-)